MFADRSRRSRRSMIVVNGTTRPTLLYPAEHSAFAKLEATGGWLEILSALPSNEGPYRGTRALS
jgi:hypothetical protein